MRRNSTGKVVYKADYHAFGTQFGKETDGDFDEVHGFNGKEYDADTGLYYYNARWYDPELGRFISEDPVADPNNPNLYSYAANNPVRFGDPTGMWNDYGDDPTSYDAPLVSDGGNSGSGDDDETGGYNGNDDEDSDSIGLLEAIGNFFESIGNWFSDDGWGTDAENAAREAAYNEWANMMREYYGDDPRINKESYEKIVNLGPHLEELQKKAEEGCNRALNNLYNQNPFGDSEGVTDLFKGNNTIPTPGYSVLPDRSWWYSVEKGVGDYLQIAKHNTTPFMGRIIDYVGKFVIYEVKAGRYICQTAQIRVFITQAKMQDKTFCLVISPNCQRLSGSLIKTLEASRSEVKMFVDGVLVPVSIETLKDAGGFISQMVCPFTYYDPSLDLRGGSNPNII